MIVLAKTVKWRTKGRLFFRRFGRCLSVSKSMCGGYVIEKENGARVIVPADGTELVCGRLVEDNVNPES